MSDLDDLGKVLFEQTQRINWQMGEAWERVLRLHLKPKPAWCPERLWHKLVNLVIHQSEQR